MSEHRGNPIRYSSITSSFQYASLNTTKLKDLITGRPELTPKDNKKHIFVGKRENVSHRQGGRMEKSPEDENSMFSNTDEHSKHDIQVNLAEPEPSIKASCPFCHRRIDGVIEGLIQDIKSWATSNVLSGRLEDSQLSEKVKTHYFPAKKNFMSESLNNSQFLDIGTVNDVKVRPLSNRNIANTQGQYGEGMKTQGMSISKLMYELAEHKAKLAEALHANDENLYELQKKQHEIRQMQAGLVEKERDYSKLEKDMFLLKQENYKCKATIHELNTNHKMLLKDFNKFTKLQIAIKSETI